jgi:hypothetical protein
VLLRPGKRVFQPVVPPEQLGVGRGETWRAEQAKPLRLFGLGPQSSDSAATSTADGSTLSLERMALMVSVSSMRRPSANSAQKTARQNSSPH